MTARRMDCSNELMPCVFLWARELGSLRSRENAIIFTPEKILVALVSIIRSWDASDLSSSTVFCYQSALLLSHKKRWISEKGWVRNNQENSWISLTYRMPRVFGEIVYLSSSSPIVQRKQDQTARKSMLHWRAFILFLDSFMKPLPLLIMNTHFPGLTCPRGTAELHSFSTLRYKPWNKQPISCIEWI